MLDTLPLAWSTELSTCLLHLVYALVSRIARNKGRSTQKIPHFLCKKNRERKKATINIYIYARTCSFLKVVVNNHPNHLEKTNAKTQ